MATTRSVLLVISMIVLAGCGPGDDTAGPGEEPDTGEDRADLSGALGGDAQLEGGCAWLERVENGFPSEVERDRIEPLWPEGYTVEFGPVRLVGPDGEVVAREGEVVHVNGEVDTDIMTICQVGQPYVVEEVVGVS